MTQFQSICLYVDTVLIIVFILVYIFKANRRDSGQEAPGASADTAVQAANSDERAVAQMACAGISEGNIRLVGVDDKLIPVILAGVSAFSNVPMSALKIKSISRI